MILAAIRYSRTTGMPVGAALLVMLRRAVRMRRKHVQHLTMIATQGSTS